MIARVIVCLGWLLMIGTLFAQETAYPDHTVRVIVPFAPGGPTDVIARVIAQKLSERFAKQFYVENHAGVGGNIGMGMVANAPADGHTILIVSSSFVVNPSLYAKIPYEPYKDFAPVTLAAASPNVLVVHPSLPVHSIQELVALVRANPGKNTFASPGIGTTPHLSGELFKQSLGLDIVHVPFNGAGPAIQSTLAGHTTIAFTALPPAMANIRDGGLRALAVTSASRSPALPEVPTLAETGIPGQEADTLQGVLVPAGTPQGIVVQLHDEIVRIINLPEIKYRLAELGFEPVGNTPEQFAQLIKSEVSRWSKVIHGANIKLE